MTYHYWYSYSLEKQNIKSARSWGQGYKCTLLVILPRDDRPSKCRYVTASHYILLWLIYGALNYSQGNNYLCVPIKDIYVQGLMQVNTQNVKLQCVISVMVVCTFRMYGVIWGEWWTHWLSCQRKTPRMIFVNFRFVHHLKHSFWLFGSDPMVFVCASNFSVSRYHH